MISSIIFCSLVSSTSENNEVDKIEVRDNNEINNTSSRFSIPYWGWIISLIVTILLIVTFLTSNINNILLLF